MYDRCMKTKLVYLNGEGFTFYLFKNPLTVLIEGHEEHEGVGAFYWDMTDKIPLEETCKKYGLDAMVCELSKELNHFRMEEIINYDNKLFIINRNLFFQPYVVCWNFDGKSWDHGTYCDSLEEALEQFNEKKAMRWES